MGGVWKWGQNVRVCVCVCYCKCFWETNHRCVEMYMATCWILSLSFSLSAFSVSATCQSPHHLFLGTLMASYIWPSSGAVAVDVCTACLISELRGQFTRAAQLLTFFFLFFCSLFFFTARSPGSSWREILRQLWTFSLWWTVVSWCGFKSLYTSIRGGGVSRKNCTKSYPRMVNFQQG